jgi:hypothetical protein
MAILTVASRRDRTGPASFKQANLLPEDFPVGTEFQVKVSPYSEPKQCLRKSLF